MNFFDGLFHTSLLSSYHDQKTTLLLFLGQIQMYSDLTIFQQVFQLAFDFSK